jgi:hypothetical protein
VRSNLRIRKLIRGVELPLYPPNMRRSTPRDSESDGPL